MGNEPVWRARFDFLDARRWADAEGKRNEPLLGGNGVQNRGSGKNVVGLRQERDGFGRGGMGGNANRTLGRIGRARMVMRGERYH